MIYILLILLLSFILIPFNKTTIKTLIIIILLGAICLIQRQLPDMDNYKAYYDSVRNGNYSDFLGVGWKYMCIFSNNLNLDYYLFKSALYMISITFLLLTIKKIDNKNTWSIFLIYLVSVGLLDLIQIRFFFGYSITLFFLILFIKSRKITRYLFFPFIILLMSFVHSSIIFFLLFLFLEPIKKFNLNKLCILFSIIILLLFMFFPNFIIDLAMLILPDYQVERINLYLNNEKVSYIGLCVYSIFFIIPLIMYEKLYRFLKLTDNSLSEINNYKIINYLILLIFPLVYMSSDFFRLQRIIFVINIIIFIKYKSYLNIQNKVFFLKVNLRNLYYLFIFIYTVLFIYIFNIDSVKIFLLGGS